MPSVFVGLIGATVGDAGFRRVIQAYGGSRSAVDSYCRDGKRGLRSDDRPS